jgi:GNAT superfamily N-acetyltransferase
MSDSEIAHTLMAKSPQPWTASAILDHGFGAIRVWPGPLASLRLSSFCLVEGQAESPDTLHALAATLAPDTILVSSDPALISRLQSLCASPFMAVRRHSFVWTQQDDRGGADRFPLPSNGRFRIVAIDAGHADRIASLPWSDDVFSSYRSIADFLARGFGFCVTCDDAIVAVCLSFAASRHGVEIEVDTDPDFQGLGLAKAVSWRFMLEAATRGLTALWDASNPASIAIARALGFKETATYDAFVVG